MVANGLILKDRYNGGELKQRLNSVVHGFVLVRASDLFKETQKVIQENSPAAAVSDISTLAFRELTHKQETYVRSPLAAFACVAAIELQPHVLHEDISDDRLQWLHGYYEQLHSEEAAAFAADHTQASIPRLITSQFGMYVTTELLAR